MPEAFLETPIEFLKGVGPSRAALLKTELGIANFGDLLHHFPFRYIDRSKFHTVQGIQSDAVQVQLRGKIIKVSEVGAPRKKRLVAIFEDETGQIELVWFKGVKWIKPTIRLNQEYVVFGKPTYFKGKYNMAHPELESPDSSRFALGSSLTPVYSTTEKLSNKGLNSKGIEKVMLNLLPEITGKVDEFLPDSIRTKLKIPAREEAFLAVHAPKDEQSLGASRKRFKFEELFVIQLGLLQHKNEVTIQIAGPAMTEVGEHFNRFFNEELPFELTNAQKRVVKEIRKDMRYGTHMNRLLQGDVGSGKTVVAILAALIAIDNGYQVCIMAPTEILAMQHYRTISKMLENMQLMVGLLTGSTKTARRKEIQYGIESGNMHILVGTHALLEPWVQFHKLGLAVIDEQHRFGVKQRSKLWKKASPPPHVLVMTATPIPRTLAMTLYGDLDVSIINELPPGRKEVKTVHRYDSKRLEVFGFVEKEIKKGRQVYFVYPLIEESETLDYKDLMDGYESIARSFPLPEYRVSIVHGKMKPEAKEHEMQQFVNGTTQIMVSTTVIEVGVDVPNASLMVIESAERFGLSQLHQLRGRVGRGADQSYCILMTDFKLSNDARTRIETMVKSADGFHIAEVDLSLRGPGDMMGTQQSGVLDLKMANITKDQEILAVARHMARELLEEDPHLENSENGALSRELKRLKAQSKNWGMIS